jgi:hypothetical protein
MPCPSHPPWLDHSNYIWRRVALDLSRLFVYQCLFMGMRNINHVYNFLILFWTLLVRVVQILCPKLTLIISPSEEIKNQENNEAK